MQHRNTRRGFTLIELLVVVLIIGILAAVALPQYQKAVEKARLQEALTYIANVEKNINLYILEHGIPENPYPEDDPNHRDFSWRDESGMVLDIPVLGCDGGYECEGHPFGTFWHGCNDNGCSVIVYRSPSIEAHYVVRSDMVKNASSWMDKAVNWEHDCQAFSSLGTWICNNLKERGWW